MLYFLYFKMKVQNTWPLWTRSPAVAEKADRMLIEFKFLCRTLYISDTLIQCITAVQGAVLKLLVGVNGGLSDYRKAASLLAATW